MRYALPIPGHPGQNIERINGLLADAAPYRPRTQEDLCELVRAVVACVAIDGQFRIAECRPDDLVTLVISHRSRLGLRDGRRRRRSFHIDFYAIDRLSSERSAYDVPRRVTRLTVVAPVKPHEVVKAPAAHSGRQ